MRYLVSGATGLIGSYLVESLRGDGNDVTRLVRRAPRDNDLLWNPTQGQIAEGALENIDVVVHLSGEPIGGKRWSAAQKRELRSSRITSTMLLVDEMGHSKQPPPVFVCASALGFYGDRGNELLHERSQPGTGFLAELCETWEAVATAAQDLGVRVVNLRSGHVLAAGSPLLTRQIPLFKRGLGAILGSGEQWWPWIALDDHIRAVRRIIDDTRFSGPVNVTSPHSVTQLDFARALAAALDSEVRLTVPSFAVKALLGEMGGAVFDSSRVVPRKLLDAGFAFRHTELAPTLRAILTG